MADKCRLHPKLIDKFASLENGYVARKVLEVFWYVGILYWKSGC